MSEWEPIESAPRDRFVLVWVPLGSVGYVALAKWQGVGWFGVDDEGLRYDAEVGSAPPSHWMELPTPPSSARDTTERQLSTPGGK